MKSFLQKLNSFWSAPLRVHRWFCWNRLKRWNASPMAWGILLTICIILYALFLGFGSECIGSRGCQSRLDKFASLEFNEVGDTIAGFGSLLAFAWLIVTVMLQSQELREQRKELRQQRKEWEKISAAQDAQVRILEKQGEIFEEEQRQRSEDRAERDVSELLDLLVMRVTKSQEKPSWTWGTADVPFNSLTIFRDFPTLESEEKLRFMLTFIFDVADRIKTQVVKYEQLPQRREYKTVDRYLSAIVRRSKSCGKTRRIRLAEVGVFRAQKALSEIIDDDRFWSCSP